MKRTKIICTMGPNTNDKNVIRELVKNGMDIARFNFSHGDHEEQLGRVKNVREIREELGLPIAMLLDTKGPEIRTGIVAGDKKLNLVAGNKYTIKMEQCEATEEVNCVSYSGLAGDVKAGDTILFDDRLIELHVDDTTATEIHCTIVNGGELGSKKGVNVPNVNINLPAITEKDKSDIIFGIEQGFDFIAASFIRNAEGVREIKKILKEHNGDIAIISKIENAEGIANIDEIIAESDGIMVARGDMGVEIPAEDVPHVQKMIIDKCNAVFKPVITATQMLDSMIRNPRPTRAEVTDIANAIYDGTDVVMLSGETANGKYPVEAVTMMAHVCETSEQYLDHQKYIDRNKVSEKNNVSNTVSYSAVAAADSLNAEAIVTPTVSGFTARLVSKYKPSSLVIATTPDEKVQRKMQILWGVKPLKADRKNSTDDIIETAVETAKNSGLVKDGDTVVLTAGLPAANEKAGERGITNMMRVLKID